MTPARLALVDDDQQFVEYLDTLLRSRGYEVQPFTSGSELLQTMHSDTPPDVVLLDVSMPGMDGLETLKAIRVAHPHVQRGRAQFRAMDDRVACGVVVSDGERDRRSDP